MAKPPENDPPQNDLPKPVADPRQARLAEALRANLARRKARARAVGTNDPAADGIAD
jgi:hypothetical protein